MTQFNITRGSRGFTTVVNPRLPLVILNCVICNYLCNQYLSPLTLWVWKLLWRGVLDTTLCDKVCQWLATGRWFSPVSFHDIYIIEILLRVSLNTITLTQISRLTLENTIGKKSCQCVWLRSEDTKWDQFGFQKCFVCVLILTSYIDNSN
jgi:hypothetical protein